eukprot:TRINITY_DN91810_c0_g1_i1.p1 TRINITY_DN91810_c0_g1~~TRINITY_DN91810_c0_g1_i1.p1  ORF type:complete len:781 (+),score=193.37 TRINITY_DN91810_c0_g1_i1:93-2435(+)
MAAQNKEGSSDQDLVQGVARVEVPVSASPHFVQPQVHVTVAKAAKLLGFDNQEELKKFTAPLLKQFGAEPLNAVVGAQLFNRLVVLCAAKTPAARKLLEELSSSWRTPGGRGRTKALPAEPVPAGPLSAWPSCAPELVGMSPEPLDRVRQYINWRCRMKHFAGIACGIVRNGSLAWYQDAGFQDAEQKVKMSGDTIVRLFSMTKCLVAAAFFTYWEEPGRNIDLDDPVSKYIPAFAEMTVLPKRGQKENQPCEKAITLRQLLTHTSGIGYGATLDDPWPPQKGSYYKIYEELSENTKSGAIANLEQWCNALAKIPLKGQPGRYWDYSYSLDVLGRVLEIISGKTLDVVIEERICGPLKMRDTNFKVPKEKAHRLGPWYKSVEIDGKPQLAHRLEVVDPGGEASGWVGANASPVLSGGGTVEVPLSMKGGMVSTFNDYIRFLIMLRNFGELDGVRVLKRETVQLMICNHIPVSCYGKKSVFVFDKPGLGYNCLGQIQAQHAKQDKGTYPGEYGWGGLAGPAWTIDPRSDMIILSMTQTAFVLDHEEYVRYAARRAIHQHIFGEVAAPSKATSYAPENFDVVKPEEGEKKAQLEKEFEQEFLVNRRTRVRGAKERAIAPGPRLDRHPSEEEVAAYQRAMAAGGSRAAPSSMREAEPAAEENIAANSQPPNKKRKAAVPKDAATPNGKTAAPGASGSPGEAQDGILYKRVAVGEQDEMKKARVITVSGDTAEVITEGDWRSKIVGLTDIKEIEETQFGIPVPSKMDQSAPTDFSFLLNKKGQP